MNIFFKILLSRTKNAYSRADFSFCYILLEEAFLLTTDNLSNSTIKRYVFFTFFTLKANRIRHYSSPVFSEMKMRMIDSMFFGKEKLLTKLYSLPPQTHIKFTLKVEINFTAILIFFFCMFSFGKLDEFSYNLLFLYCPSLRLLFHWPLFNLTLQKIFCGKKKSYFVLPNFLF